MTKEEIQTLVTETVTAALVNFKPTGFITEKEADQKVSAALSAYKPEKATLSETEIAEIAAKAEAAFTAKLGSGPLLTNLKNQNDKANTYEAKLAEYEKNAPNPATAAARLMKDHPELAEARRQHLESTRARLTNAA